MSQDGKNFKGRLAKSFNIMNISKGGKMYMLQQDGTHTLFELKYNEDTATT
jgi:hypothetical protein